MSEFIEMRNSEIESLLVQEFEHLLGIDGVDRNSNFFVCGGDSLTAIELIERIRSRLGIDSELDLGGLPLWLSIAEIAVWVHNVLLGGSSGEG